MKRATLYLVALALVAAACSADRPSIVAPEWTFILPDTTVTR